MKKMIAVLALALTATAAQADGFKCSAVDGTLDVQVFNHASPELGTRNAAVMVLSDPLISYGNKTIARFTDSTSLLSNEGASYEAKVDLRYVDSRRKGELIAGTKLGQIDMIRLDLPFSYSRPVPHGARLEGSLEIEKRNGDVIALDMDCVRYLKN